VLDEAGRQQVVRAVRRLCPSWLASERDDIVQITLLRLHQSVAASEGKGRPAASYIWKTAYTVMVDEIRRRARRPEAPMDQAALDVAGGNPSPEELAKGKQLGLAIRDCLAGTVPARRSAAVLHLQGHTVPEIARLMQWDEKKAENLVYRALSDLRMCLASKGLKP
jgi:RNA polymerase sigma-70 factor (ECF subfamily)